MGGGGEGGVGVAIPLVSCDKPPNHDYGPAVHNP
jgi:hypothetical protein